jgi:hypothetical protein
MASMKTNDDYTHERPQAATPVLWVVALAASAYLGYTSKTSLGDVGPWMLVLASPVAMVLPVAGVAAWVRSGAQTMLWLAACVWLFLAALVIGRI